MKIEIIDKCGKVQIVNVQEINDGCKHKATLDSDDNVCAIGVSKSNVLFDMCITLGTIKYVKGDSDG